MNEVPRSPTTFDAEQALQQVDGDKELLEEITDLFFEDAPDLLNQIGTAVAQNDCEGLLSSAHALKGAVSNFAAGRARDLAFDLEQMGRDEQLTADAGDKHQALEVELQNFHDELRAFIQTL